MMSIKPAKVQFNGGELSPWLEGRVDIAKYDKTAKLCRNFIPLAEGSLKRRGGTRFVAETLQSQDLLFQIKTVPEDALVYINGITSRSIYVAEGDVVEYEVQAEGFEVVTGKVVVVQNTELLIELMPSADSVKLEIKTVPENAIVKINGIIRKIFIGKIGQEVSYIAYKDGYDMITGSEVLTEDKEVVLTLQQIVEEGGSYGTWGEPICFVSCTALGYLTKQFKVFLFRFSYGYLAIVFNANKLMPDSSDLRVFINEVRSGFDSVAWKNNQYYLTRLTIDDRGIYYKDLNGNNVVCYSKGEMMTAGWQADEDRQYASFYTRYDGTLTGRVFRIYYQGGFIWKLEGNENG